MAGKRNKSGRKDAQRIEKAGGDVAIAERELSKGNAKIAVKHARVAYRVDPSESTGSLLRRALLQRTRELQGRNLRDEARAVLAELGGVATSGNDDAQEIRRLEVLLGVGDARQRAEDVAANEGLFYQVVDEAVLVGDARSCPQELQSDVKLVRSALQSISAGAGEQCLTSLQTIGRGSPLADWRLFARGLIAFYEGDDDRRESNWNRLDPGRSASRIARALTEAASPDASSPAENERASYRIAAASALLRHPAELLVKKLQTSLTDETGDWDHHFLAIKRLCAATDPALFERISTAVAYLHIKNGDWELLKRLQGIGPLLTIDPHMNRAFAHFFELEEEYPAAAHHWEQYLEDVKRLDAISEAHRPTACALVACEAANAYYEAASQPFSIDAFQKVDEGHSLNEIRQASMRRSDELFAFSRSLDPSLREAYVRHCRLLTDRNETSNASQLYEKFAQRFPNDFDAQMEAMAHFRGRANDPQKALEFGRAAEQLRPRDDQLATEFWHCAFDLASMAARSKAPAKARAHLDAAASYIGPGRDSYALLAMRAGVELKAGNETEAEELQRRCLAEANDPAAARLAVCVSACRCGASGSLRKRLNSELEQFLKSEASTTVGAAMARYLNSLYEAHIAYQGKTAHEKLVQRYLNRVLRLSWCEADLVDVCCFALGQGKCDPFLMRLGSRGQKLFPDNPWFPYAYARGAAEKGFTQPTYLRRLIRALNRTIRLSDKKPAYALPKQLLADASRLLELAEKREFLGLAGVGGWGPAGLNPEALLEEAGLDSEVIAGLGRLGISLDALFEALARGDDPEEFFNRYLP